MCRSRDRYDRGRYLGNRSDRNVHNRERSSSRTRSEEKRCHYYRKPVHFIRECEKNTKDVAQKKGQSPQMHLMADVTERNWIDSWPETTQIDVESQLNTGNTYQMMAGSNAEDNIKQLHL